ncbi:MAG: hypothetical protein WCP20_05770, partial [Desulfuromonadales bacterium]
MNAGQMNLNMLQGVTPSITSDVTLIGSVPSVGEKSTGRSFANLLSGMCSKKQAILVTDSMKHQAVALRSMREEVTENPDVASDSDLLGLPQIVQNSLLKSDCALDAAMNSSTEPPAIRGADILSGWLTPDMVLFATGGLAVVAAYEQRGRLSTTTTALSQEVDMTQKTPVSLVPDQLLPHSAVAALSAEPQKAAVIAPVQFPSSVVQMPLVPEQPQAKQSETPAPQQR